MGPFRYLPQAAHGGTRGKVGERTRGPRTQTPQSGSATVEQKAPKKYDKHDRWTDKQTNKQTNKLSVHYSKTTTTTTTIAIIEV